MTFYVKADIPIPADFIGDIFVTAIEGGINYWAHIEELERNDAGDYITATVCDAEDYEIFSFTESHKITYMTLVKGIEKSFEKDMHYCEYLLEKDAGMIDAEGADCIVQLGLFGEIVYG